MIKICQKRSLLPWGEGQDEGGSYDLDSLNPLTLALSPRRGKDLLVRLVDYSIGDVGHTRILRHWDTSGSTIHTRESNRQGARPIVNSEMNHLRTVLAWFNSFGWLRVRIGSGSGVSYIPNRKQRDEL